MRGDHSPRIIRVPYAARETKNHGRTHTHPPELRDKFDFPCDEDSD